MARAPKSSSKPAKSPPAVWSAKASATLVATLKAEKDGGRMAESGFKRSSWTEVINDILAATGVSYTLEQCKNHWNNVSMLFFRCILRTYGYGYS